ncbi:MAG: hypothetical protein KAI03_05930 [Candidatus Aureabacteria bacterium]|nr:hypothetical protein [Candidatus Auribacterota bacterium]MCK5655810.1 hypothetical protein [Candidatus Auribacterota bacterium]
MKIETFVVCDAAADYYGKLNILGAFDSMVLKKMPYVHPQCAVALRLRFSQIEEGGHKFRINIIDEDGKPVIKHIDGGVKVSFDKCPYNSIALNIVLNIQNLKIGKYGEYAIDLAIDGKQEASLPIFVTEKSKKV